MKNIESKTEYVNLPIVSQAITQTFPRGAEVVVKTLIKNGVDTVFGYPGGAVLHIYDEIWRYRDEIT
ncbi:MAG: hypothetical protein MUC29_12330, partial [Pyrinomonadaceae bacterium]|nr:hypothetical protein [Pyrinomonadaceae bacterium]